MLARGTDDRLRQRMLAFALDRGGRTQQLALVELVGGNDRDDLRLALGQRARLSRTTVIAKSSASSAARSKTPNQTRKVPSPPTSATKTSQKAARSASRCAGAFEFCASWTSLTICASAVSEPTAVARARSVPCLLMSLRSACR